MGGAWAGPGTGGGMAVGRVPIKEVATRHDARRVD